MNIIGETCSILRDIIEYILKATDCHPNPIIGTSIFCIGLGIIGVFISYL